MLDFPKWKLGLVVVLVLFAALYALPNLFPQEPAIQISANRGGSVDDVLQGRVEGMLKGNKIDYFAAVSGQLQLIPAGESLAALEKDYAAMLEDGLLALNQPSFADIIEQCRAIQDEANRQAR